MSRIIQPFSKPVARIVITMDQNGQIKMEGENHAVKVSGVPEPLSILQTALMLSGCLNGTIQAIVSANNKNKGLINPNATQETPPNNSTD